MMVTSWLKYNLTINQLDLISIWSFWLLTSEVLGLLHKRNIIWSKNSNQQKEQNWMAVKIRPFSSQLLVLWLCVHQLSCLLLLLLFLYFAFRQNLTKAANAAGILSNRLVVCLVFFLSSRWATNPIAIGETGMSCAERRTRWGEYFLQFFLEFFWWVERSVGGSSENRFRIFFWHMLGMEYVIFFSVGPLLKQILKHMQIFLTHSV